MIKNVSQQMLVGVPCRIRVLRFVSCSSLGNEQRANSIIRLGVVVSASSRSIDFANPAEILFIRTYNIILYDFYTFILYSILFKFI